MRPVLLIGHDDWETFGLGPGAFESAGIPWMEHPNHTGAPLPELSEISGIVLYGGSMNVDQTDRFPFLAHERTYVRAAVDAGIPYLGSCLGAQMLARALDHPVYPAGIREIGFHALHPAPEASDDALLSVFRDGDRVFHWHEDTFELPQGATLLASGDGVPTQAFRYGDAAWGLQFHFEVDRNELDLWLKTAGGDGVRAWGSTPDRIREDADRHLDDHEQRGREVFRRFAEVVRRRS